MSPSKPGAMVRTMTLLFAAAAILLSVDAFAATLASVRVGPHKNFDRMVFEFDRECASFVTAKGNQKVEILFKNADTGKSFTLPPLPPGLVAIKSIDAFRVGDSDVAFEITLARDASASELPLNGKPWRMAIDLAPKISQSESKKPEYIPGDQPIPTKFAEASAPDGPPEPAAKSDPLRVDNSVDPAKARAVLAYFYLAGGDTPKAREFADAYQQLTGEALDIPAHANTASNGSFFGNVQLSAGWIIAIALVAGMFGGAIGAWATARLAKLSRKRTAAAAGPRELSDELESDLAELEQTVKAEAKPRTPDPQAERTKQRAGTAAEAVTAAPPEEEEVKESLMDRRVRRVLELSKAGRPVGEIAAELEMGQDEVKLILDLNS